MKSRLLASAIAVVVGLLMSLPPTVQATTVVVTFEDLIDASSDDWAFIPSSYQGLTFGGAGLAMPHNYLNTLTGIKNGTIGHVSWFSGSAGVFFSSTNPFYFEGAYITSMLNNNQQVTVQGWLAGASVYSETITTSWSSAQYFTFGFENVDKVTITPLAGGTLDPSFAWAASQLSGTRYLVIDNVTYVHSPEPSSLLLLGSGLAGVGIWHRMRKRTCL